MGRGDWDTSSQAATELATFAGLGSSAAGSTKTARTRDSKYKDAFTWKSGKPVCCEACGDEKSSKDPAFPSETLWWDNHGSDDPSRHSTMCLYDEVSWKKVKYDMNKTQFLEWAVSADGKKELSTNKEKMVEKRRVGGRITAKLLSPSETASVKRKTIDETAINEPDDVWVNSSKYEEENGGRKPEADGITCTWITKSDGTKLHGYWKPGEGPITRSKRMKTQVEASEEVDNSESALTEDQLAQRFKAEAKAMHAAAPAAQSKTVKDDDSDVPKTSAAPVGRGLLAGGEEVPAARKGQQKRRADAQQPSSSSANAKAPKLGGTPNQSAQAGPIPTVRMLEQKAENGKAWDGFVNCKKLEEIVAAEREAIKCIKSLEKKQQRLQLIEKLDSAHLAFQIEVDESHEKLTSMAAAMAELRKFKGAAGAKAKPSAGQSSLEASKQQLINHSST